MPRRIAFIGSRDTDQFDPEWLTLYTTAAARCAKNGCIIVTGAAPGCDQLAAEAALKSGGSVELVLPWQNYEAEWVLEMIECHPERVSCDFYQDDIHAEWRDSVANYHPIGDRLRGGALALHARNYGIVYGATCVVAMPGIVRPGGTGQGLRIAEALGIPVYNLTTAKGREDLAARLGTKKAVETEKKGMQFISTFPLKEVPSNLRGY